MVGKSRGSKLPYWSASIRAEQNISEWQALATPQLQERFLTFFAEPARLLHSRPWQPDALPKRVRVRRKDWLAEIYRLFPHCQESWTALKRAIAETKEKKKKDNRSPLEAIIYDWCQVVLTPGQMVSVWNAPDTLGQGAQGNPHMFELSTFEVVTGDVSRKKVQHSVGSNMILPVYIQRWKATGAIEVQEAMTVKREDLPQLVDAVSLYSWRCWKTARLWTTRETIMEETCVERLSGPVLVSSLYTDPRAVPIPVFYLSELLKAQGWRFGAPPIRTHDGSNKLFVSKKLDRRRQYLRCLCLLPTLLQSMRSLSATQKEAYYECILHSEDPGSVPLGATAETYKKLLSSLGVQTEAAAAAARHAADEGSDSAQDDAESSEDPELDVEIPLAAATGAVESGDGEAAGGAEEATLESLGLPSEVAGQRLFLDTHKGYTRVCVHCPLGRDAHSHPTRICRKYRSVNANQTRNYGVKEVAAYLGSWVEAAAQFEDAQRHIHFAPKEQDVRGFIEKTGWL